MLDASMARMTGVNIARKHIGWYTKGLPGSAEFRNRVNQQDDPAGRGDAARILRAVAPRDGCLTSAVMAAIMDQFILDL